MPFQAGVSGNPSGRKVGATGVESRRLKSLLTTFLESKAEAMEAIFDSLEPKDQANLIIKLMEYVLPKVSSQVVGDNVIAGDFFTEQRKSLTEEAA